MKLTKRLGLAYRVLRGWPVMTGMGVVGEGEVFLLKQSHMSICDNALSVDQGIPHPREIYVSLSELCLGQRKGRDAGLNGTPGGELRRTLA